MPLTSHKRRWFAVQGALTLVLLIALFRNFDVGACLSALGKIPPWFYAVSFCMLFAGQLLYAFKWQLVCRAMGTNIGFGRLAEQYFISIFFNNFLPTAFGGDVARVYYLGKREGYASVGTSVFLDRMLGFLFMTVWATLLVWSFDVTSSSFVVTRQALTALSLAFMAVVLAIVFLPAGSITSGLRKVPWPSALDRALEAVGRYTGQVKRRPGILLWIMITVLTYFVALTGVYIGYFRLATGESPPFWPILAVLLSIGILSNLPISLNGIGLREQLHYLLFASLGVSKELAVGISLIIFSQILLLSVIGYVLWLRMRWSYPIIETAGAR